MQLSGVSPAKAKELVFREGGGGAGWPCPPPPSRPTNTPDVLNPFLPPTAPLPPPASLPTSTALLSS